MILGKIVQKFTSNFSLAKKGASNLHSSVPSAVDQILQANSTMLGLYGILGSPCARNFGSRQHSHDKFFFMKDKSEMYKG